MRANALTRTLGLEAPILQAPMAGAQGPELAVAVSTAGGLGALPCAMLTPEKIREDVQAIRAKTSKPFNLNFFCYRTPASDTARDEAWRAKLRGYYLELGLDPAQTSRGVERKPFDSTLCELVLELKPRVASFHFGLPEADLVSRLKTAGILVLSSATTVAEARWLEERGCDAIIAQGYEAGGHRGIFLSENPADDVSRQVGTMALVPQIVDGVRVPVIASGGIADARGIVAALALGAQAVQLGTAYLFCPEAKISPVHLKALKSARDGDTVLTNVFSGRPARSIVNRLVRELGPLSPLTPEFPNAGHALAPLKAKSEPAGSGDFMSLWSGQAAALGRALPAAELTRTLAREAEARLRELSGI